MGAMTNEVSPTAPKSWIWLVIAGVLTVVSIAWLWSMTAPRVCILIYPAPPGCATLVPNWLPFVGIAIVAVLFLAMIVLSLVRRPAPARPLVLLTIVIAVVTLLTALVMLLAGLGMFDASQPPVLVD
jgi:hypothetical protein